LAADALEGTLANVKGRGLRAHVVCATGHFFCIISAVGHWPSSCEHQRREFELRFQLPILDRKPRRSARRGFLICKARWQSGHAAACKAVYAGSIPTLASNCHLPKALEFRGFVLETCRC
jgi:hypothetical protein